MTSPVFFTLTACSGFLLFSSHSPQLVSFTAKGRQKEEDKKKEKKVLLPPTSWGHRVELSNTVTQAKTFPPGGRTGRAEAIGRSTVRQLLQTVYGSGGAKREQQVYCRPSSCPCSPFPLSDSINNSSVWSLNIYFLTL